MLEIRGPITFNGQTVCKDLMLNDNLGNIRIQADITTGDESKKVDLICKATPIQIDRGLTPYVTLTGRNLVRKIPFRLKVTYHILKKTFEVNGIYGNKNVCSRCNNCLDLLNIIAEMENQ